ncbi:hypothetical protein H6F98_01135 [Microcoleus sp. FACHB-SPT15]|nr:hypothetical protein [Microcoleus sp. FACHB-SPT15]MBD1804079.1 hypothetical protein [Microcoleus sp. FACHB-SPT15]
MYAIVFAECCIEDSQKYLIAVDDLEEHGYRVVSNGGITDMDICKVHL